MLLRSFIVLTSFLITASLTSALTPEGKYKLVLIAGKPSHAPGLHEFRAGTILLAECLKSIPNLVVELGENDWVKDESVFDDADAIVIYADGGKHHPAVQENHLIKLRKLIAKGIGFGCMHYAIDVEPDSGGKEFLEWIGGYYETNYSCNPIWNANYTKLPETSVTNGVNPFMTNDEWYFSIRFRPEFSDGTNLIEKSGAFFTPVLSAIPSDATREGPYVSPQGPFKHIQDRKGQAETTMWTLQRADGGRGFGFTGGHFHKNWGNDDLRKVVLNSLVWLTKMEVPVNGVESKVSEEQLSQNLDKK
jgi:Trehalose utilisation